MRGLAVQDFDSDGHLDVATASADGVHIYWGNGAGGFDNANVALASGTPRFVVAGDFDGDGRPDLAYERFTAGQDTVSLLNQGQRQFVQGTASQVGASLVVGGAFEEARFDLVTTSIDPPIATFRGAATGDFAAGPTYSGGALPMNCSSDVILLSSGDINHDGNLDIVFEQCGYLTVMFGHGNLFFREAYDLDDGLSGTGLRGLQVSDYNGDGLVDIVASGVGGDQAEVYVAYGTSDGGLDPTTLLPGPGVGPFTFGDFLGDGGRELVCLRSNRMTAVREIGDGGFSQGVTIGPPLPFLTPLGGTPIDLDEDGKPDFLATGSSGQTYAVLSSQRPEHLDLDARAISMLPNAVVADLNHDGRPDLLVSDSHEAVAKINTGHAHFADYPLTIVSAGWFAAGDLDGDGVVDLVTEIPADAGGGVGVLLGVDGGFGDEWQYNPGLAFSGVSFVDFNGDGNLDVMCRMGQKLAFLPGDGLGHLGFPTYLSVPNGEISVALGDVNGDGATDVVTAPYIPASGALQVYLSSFDGGFRALPPASVPCGTYQISLADLDGDGLADLVGSCVLNAGISASLLVAQSFGDGGFGSFAGASTLLYYGQSGDQVGVGDYTGDGIPDLLVSTVPSASPSILTVIPGAGGGKFGQAIFFAQEFDGFPVALADFDGDCLPDMLVDGNGFGLLLSQ